jgi:hypothetical protein
MMSEVQISLFICMLQGAKKAVDEIELVNGVTNVSSSL